MSAFRPRTDFGAAAAALAPRVPSGGIQIPQQPQTPWQQTPFGPNGQGFAPQAPQPVGGAPIGGGGAFGAGGAPSPFLERIQGLLGIQPVSWNRPIGTGGGFGYTRPTTDPGYFGGVWDQMPQGPVDSASVQTPVGSPSTQQPKMTIQGGSMQDLLGILQGGGGERRTMENRLTPGSQGYDDFQQWINILQNGESSPYSMAAGQGGQRNPAEVMEELLDRLNERREERSTRAVRNRGGNDGRRRNDPRRTARQRSNPGSNRARMNDLW